MERRLLACTLVSLSACGPMAWNGEEATQAMVVQGKWVPSSTTLSRGDTQVVAYQGAPLVSSGGSCASSNPWTCSCTHSACHASTPGATEFAAFLRKKFPQISGLGGLGSCCRQSTGATSYLSVHSLGRAIDFMIPEIGGDADNTKGDPIAAWLIENAQSIGVQYIVWDRARWGANRPAGQRYGDYTGSLSHTDHMHVELNLDAAAKKTPFFTSGQSTGTTTCKPHCEGDVAVATDCSTTSCAARGAKCAADAGSVCRSPGCPATGSAKICADSSNVSTCQNGLVVSTGNCALYGAFCSTAGVAETAARCVVGLCVNSPETVPEAHMACAAAAGMKLSCSDSGGATHVPCPAGQVCSVTQGAVHCEAPRAECPVPDAGSPSLVKTTCLSSGELALCINGNVVSAEACMTGGRCSLAGGSAHCVRDECVADGGLLSGRDVCTSSGDIARCDSTGGFSKVTLCSEGLVCGLGSGGVACIPGIRPTSDLGDEDLPGDLDMGAFDGGAASDAGMGASARPVEAGCGCQGTSGISLLAWAFATSLWARRRFSRER